MFKNFTEEAIHAISFAQEESRRLGHNRCGTEQILLGLLKERKSVAAQVLNSFGVTLKDARSKVEQLIGRGTDFPQDLQVIKFKPNAEMPFSENTKRVFESASSIAQKQSSDYVLHTGHLLIAILRLDECRAIRILQGDTIDLAKLEQSVLTSDCHECNYHDLPYWEQILAPFVRFR
jgi:ATP-dependent Clp protease ATP-binding subunit ClpA